MDNAKPSLLSKLVQEAIGESRVLGCQDDEAQLRYPCLWEWLTSSAAGTSHTKEPGRLQIAAIPGGWLVSVSDPSLGVTLETTSVELDNCISLLEAALQSNKATVRVWAKQGANLRKKQDPKK